MRLLLPIAALLALQPALAASAQSAGAAQPAATARPAVGDQLPADFRPADATGTARPLGSLAGPGGLVLVLARSAGWCPYCQAHMKELVAAVGPLQSKGYRLAALTYDDPAVLAKFASRQSIPYPLLSDPGGRLIAAMGLSDPSYPPGHMAHGVAVATVLVVDPAGRIQAIDISPDYRKRPSTADVIAMVPAKNMPTR